MLDSIAPECLSEQVHALFGAREVTVDWGSHVLRCSRDTAHRILSGSHGRAPTLAEAVAILDAAGSESIARALAWRSGMVVQRPHGGVPALAALASASVSASAAVSALVDAQADGTVSRTEQARVLREAEGALERLGEAVASLRVVA